METKETLTRRDFVAAGAAVTAAIAAPAILGAQSKSGNKLPVMGQGEYMYEVEHDWALANLPSTIKYGNTHSVIQDSNGLIYIHHTVHKESPSGDAVVVFDPKGKFVRSWGSMFRDSAHGMHIQKEGNTEYLYFADEKHGIVTKRTLNDRTFTTRGSHVNTPSTSVKIWQASALSAPASAIALKSEPPRPKVVVSPSALCP